MSDKQQQQSPGVQQCPVSSSPSSEVVMCAQGTLRDAKTCNKFAHDIESVEDLRLLPHMLPVTGSPSTSSSRTASSVTGTMGTTTGLATPSISSVSFATSVTGSPGSDRTANDALLIYVARGYTGREKKLSPSTGSTNSSRSSTALSPNPYDKVCRRMRNSSCSSASSGFRSPVRVNSNMSVNTSSEMDIGRLPDPFTEDPRTPPSRFYDTTAPPTATLNKYARGARSMKDLRKIENDFPEKKNKDNAADVYLIEPIQGSCEAVIREYSIESLEDLRLLPSFSEICISHTAISFTPPSSRRTWSDGSLAELQELPSMSQSPKKENKNRSPDDSKRKMKYMS
ncbi:hypothetical protein WR25_05577 [Diploscapter pachys]|uniref:Uncharacterized protein n=1 Tax=Diploscapter pachys TaxID=2018661 RepID=A0A2A2LSW0_9BILA|nr:hypothetical protein WR25_05577 [Diploscapter pachys]